MKSFFIKVSVVSQVFLYADFMENLCLERVKPGKKCRPISHT